MRKHMALNNLNKLMKMGFFKKKTVLNGIKEHIIMTKVTYHYKPVITFKS